MTVALEGGEWSAARPGRTFTPGKDAVPIAQGAGWAPGPVWTGGKSRPHRNSIPNRPARSQSLYQLSYPAHPQLVVRRNTESQVRKELIEKISTKSFYEHRQFLSNRKHNASHCHLNSIKVQTAVLGARPQRMKYKSMA